MKQTVLSSMEIDRIVTANYANPFELLGIHPLGNEHDNRFEIRCFCPSAVEVCIKSQVTGIKTMSKVHSYGLFVFQSLPLIKPFDYTLILKDSKGNSWETADPYSFAPQLTTEDLYLFSEGTHTEIHNRFGARIWTIGKAQGVLFSVWAPNAGSVSVIGSFNDWDRRRHPMRTRGRSGIWELFIPGIRESDLYKFSIKTQDGNILDKSDPLAHFSELRPRTASVVYDIDNFSWSDDDWMKKRERTIPASSPISIYELHPASWLRPHNNQVFLTWKELSKKLIPYIKKLGFTHIELLPIMEHPFDGSWGYQTLGYFSPTSRFGTPTDFQEFIDSCHKSDIGVILDWAPAHFPADESGLAMFDGTHLYEHEDPRLGIHPDWNTHIFNYDRKEVWAFLIASALFWLDKYHIDGIRVDAVASMLYRDYSRKDGEWIPNEFGGRGNLGAVAFLKRLNEQAHSKYPGVMMIAEESTAWPGVTRPVSDDGLGFTFKWNMGWMNDTLKFFTEDPLNRKYHFDKLTFSLLYAFSENFILPISHDETVHEKGSLIDKFPGDKWQKLANLRLFLAYMWAHPGKQLLFMGSELAQWTEWNHDGEVDWQLLDLPEHQGISNLVADLNKLYTSYAPLFELDSATGGFRWIDHKDMGNSVISFIRYSKNGEYIICVFNLTPVVRSGYMLGVPEAGTYVELLNTDSMFYDGSDKGNLGETASKPVRNHGYGNSLELTLPPLAAVFLEII